MKKERNHNKNVKNAISPQHENRRRIFISFSFIDSIPNPNVFIPALGVAAFSGLASTGVQKLIGKGLHLIKRLCVPD